MKRKEIGTVLHGASPILVREFGGLQFFRWPDTGEEFAITINKPIDTVRAINNRVILRFRPVEGASLPKQVAKLGELLPIVSDLGARELLNVLRKDGVLELFDVERWKAEDFVRKSATKGIVVELIDLEAGRDGAGQASR